MKPYRKTILHALVILFGTVVGAIVIGLACLPGYFIITSAWAHTAEIASPFWRGILVCFSIGTSYFLFVYSLLLAIVSMRHFLGFINDEHEAPIYSWVGFKIGGYNFLISLAKILALPLVRTTPIIVWFYKGMGMKIGKNTIISTTRLWDCDLIEIGRNCVIGGNVAISAHITSAFGQGILKKVIIGDRVSIGADTSIFPGAVIERNVIIGPSSVVPINAHLEANSYYEGVPVKKIR